MQVFVIAAFIALYLLIRWKLDPDFFNKQRAQSVAEEDYEKPRGISSWSRNTRDNQLIAYIYMASVMIRTNREESREKMQFVHRYIARYFKGVGIKPGEYMSEALRYDVHLPSVTGWINKRMSEGDKWKLMEFLIALSLEDGVINDLEFKRLKNIGVTCGLSAGSVEERIVRQRKSREQSRQNTVVPRREDLKVSALRVLGFDELVPFSEIKRRHRSLVKRYHPDGWNSSVGLTKEAAENRFLEVQKAYEYLEILLA